MPKQEKVSPQLMVVYVVASIVATVANYITFKQLLNHYRTRPTASPERTHNYEFFANQLNTGIYVIFTLFVVAYKALSVGPAKWFKKQDIPWQKFALMGFLDAAAGFLSTIGGAYTDGGLQNLLNQCAIPGTIITSYLFLGETVNKTQGLGSFAILLGTSVSILPALIVPSSHSTTTVAGVMIYLCGIIPTCISNVYKEAAFRTKNDLHVDIFLLSSIVAVFQVFFGFLFIPILAFPGFGGIPLSEIPNQMTYGFACFLGQNSQPGDHCGSRDNVFQSATAAMLIYCFVNFGFNLLSLVVTKYGSAVLMVVSSALALPITNLAFASVLLMGKAAESFSDADVAALVIVVIGFVVYSSDGVGLSSLGGDGADAEKLRHSLLPFQPRGSVAYLPRSNSDPNIFWSASFTPKSSTSRFGRYSPATKMINRSPRNLEYRPDMRSDLSKSPMMGITYNALSTTPPLNITRNVNGSDAVDLEMMEMPLTMEASSL